jgi:hypothetical protein
MKKIFLILALFTLIGCSTPPRPPLVLLPPAKSIPMKTFSGTSWELSIEDDTWSHPTVPGYDLVLINKPTYTVIMMETFKDVHDLYELALDQQSEFKEDLKWNRSNVIFAGQPGLKYEMRSKTQHVWGWLTIKNGTGYFFTCGTSLSKEKDHSKTCQDFSAGLRLK